MHSGSGGGPEATGAPGARGFAVVSPGASSGTRRASCSWRSRSLVVLWIGIKAADNFEQFVTVTLNGLSLSALYFVVASGFTLIFGLMRVVNMAHGTLYLFGGYLALNFQQKLFADDAAG